MPTPFSQNISQIGLTLDQHTTIAEVLRFHADRSPDSLAILEPGWRAMTHAGLAEQLGNTSQSLKNFGFGPSDRIALVLHPGAVSAACVLTISACATAVPLNPQYSQDEFNRYFLQIAPSAVVLRAKYAHPARDAAELHRIPILELSPDPTRGAGSFDLECGQLAGSQPSSTVAEGTRYPALIVLTSGSTSRPKLVPLDHYTLIHRALKHAQWLELSAHDIGLLFMPLFHGQGLNAGLYPPLLVGGAIIAVADFDPSRFARLLREYAPTWFPAGPTHLRALLAEISVDPARFGDLPIRFIRTGSGQLSAKELATLQDAFRSPVIETYNTTETGQIAGGLLSWSRNEGGVSPMSVSGEVAIMSENGALLKPGESGEVVTRGASVFSGYMDDGVATADAFCNGWCRTGDIGVLDDEGFLAIKGRIKDVISRGGDTISPQEVETVLESHPAVRRAAACAIPHPTLGEQVAAAVLVNPGTATTPADLKTYARNRLATFKVPRRIIFVDELPIGPTGKIRRETLAEQISALNLHEGLERVGRRGVTTPLEADLIEIWRRHFGRDDIGVDDDFFLLGGDSLQAIELFLAIEKRLKKVLPRSILLTASSVGEMARLIDSSLQSKCLVPINPEGRLPPLYCVHDGLGQVLLFRHLARHLGSEQPLFGLQARGLDGKAPFHASIEEMARDYLTEIRAHQPCGPYYIAGYSFGGKVAFEMARQLQTDDSEIGLLILLDSHILGPGSYVSPWTWLRRHRERIAKLPRGEITSYLKKRAQNVSKFVRGRVYKSTVTRAIEMTLSGEPVSPDLLPAIAAHLSRLYRPQMIDCRAVMFRAELYPWAHPDVYTRWNDWIENGLRTRHVPGNHEDFLEEPHVADVALQLIEELQLAREFTSSLGLPTKKH